MKNRFVSLKFRMLLITVLSILLAIGLFVFTYTLGNFLVWKYYLDDKMVEERKNEYISDFQNYVTNNDLFTTDEYQIQSWQNSQFMELIIFKDDELIYYPGRFEEDTEAETEISTDSEAATDQVEGETEETTKEPEYSYGEGRDFRDFLNDEAKKEYQQILSDILAGNSELSPVIFKDGTLLVTVVDNSADFMSGTVVVSSAVLALVVMIIIMMISFSRLTVRITRLADDVQRLERDLVQIPIKNTSRDEITTLASDINSMRNTIVTNMRKEQEAWEANTGLITAMSHDIRTPLTVLLGYIDLLELQSDDETSREYLTACRENAIRLKKLSDDMFGYFLVFGKREIQLDYLSHPADSVIHHMIDEHVILLCEKGYEVNKISEDICGEICVDLLYFGRVIDNIFSNITKYADKNHPVQINLSACDDKILLEFSNKISDVETSESNEIGIKTCVKIMEQMNGEFRSYRSADTFFVKVSVPLQKTK